MKSASFSVADDITEISRKFCFYLKTNTNKLIEKEDLSTSISLSEIRRGTLRFLFNNLGTNYETRSMINMLINSYVGSIETELAADRAGRFIEIFYNNQNMLTAAVRYDYFNLGPELFTDQTLTEYTRNIVDNLISVPKIIIKFIKFRNKIQDILTSIGDFDYTKEISLDMLLYMAKNFNGDPRCNNDNQKAVHIVSITNRLKAMEGRIDLSNYSCTCLNILHGIYSAFYTSGAYFYSIPLQEFIDFSSRLDTIEEENA